MSWKLQWRNSDPLTIETLDELNAVLDEVHERCRQSKPHLAQIEREDGRLMLVGLGLPVSVLTHAEAGGWPSRSSRNDMPFDKNESIGFYMGTYWSEMPMNYAIPLNLARKAVTYFCQTGEALPDVRWYDD